MESCGENEQIGREMQFTKGIASFVASMAFAIQGAVAADEALIAAAKKEGAVTWYTTQIVTQFARPAAEAFQKKYGVKVDFVRGDSVEIALRVTNEAKAGRVFADVFDSTSGLGALKRENLIEPWIPEAARRLPEAFWDKDAYWVATNVFIHQPSYNTNLVARGSEPKTYEDLLDPRWKGKMSWAGHATPSGGPGFVGVILHAMGQEKGLAYLRQLATQNITPLSISSRAAVDQVIAGEYSIVLQALNHQPVISARLGAPVDWMPLSPALGILSVASLMKNSPHPNAGKLLIDYFISDEGQKLFQGGDYITVDPAIPPREASLSPSGGKFSAFYLTPEQLEAALPKWTQTFRDIFR